jgi:hypothetical protein
MERRYLIGFAVVSLVFLTITWYFIPKVAYLFGAYLLFYFSFEILTRTQRTQRIQTYDIVHKSEYTQEQLNR